MEVGRRPWRWWTKSTGRRSRPRWSCLRRLTWPITWTSYCGKEKFAPAGRISGRFILLLLPTITVVASYIIIRHNNSYIYIHTYVYTTLCAYCFGFLKGKNRLFSLYNYSMILVTTQPKGQFGMYQIIFLKLKSTLLIIFKFTKNNKIVLYI